LAGAVGALAGAVQGVARVRAAVLPGAFGSLAGQLRYVRQVSPEEYSSECPRCGGEPHPNGEWPDRFRLFLRGYSMVISPALNQPGWVYTLGGTSKDLLPYKGYWVVMENADVLVGFSTTPITP